MELNNDLYSDEDLVEMCIFSTISYERITTEENFQFKTEWKQALLKRLKELRELATIRGIQTNVESKAN